MKLPAFQFYPGDWRKDPGVQALDFHNRGVWLEMICLMHESEQRGKLMLNGAPMPEDALARLLGLDKQNLTTTLTTLLTYGVASRCEETGAIICRRMVRDENLRKIRTEAGKKGGNPVLLNQNPTTKVKQKTTPSSSSSVSTSISSSDKKESKAKGTLDEIKAFVKELGLPESDGEASFYKWEGNGWMNGKAKIKDWKATIRSWKASGYLPSQKPGQPHQQSAQSYKPVFDVDDRPVIPKAPKTYDDVED